MITGLDDPHAVDPGRVGAKAAALAQARRSGLPVLPGFVVDTSASASHLALGSSMLGPRGSGGARLVVASEPIPESALIVAAGRGLAANLAVRSSSPLEGGGEWAGAFNTFLDITPDELPRAVAGCWASTFSVDALQRQLNAGIEPGAVPMAVLVQPAIDATVGGVAEISPDGRVEVEAVPGSPAAMLQGWARGAVATRAPDQAWHGAEAITLVGSERLDDIASALTAAREHLGFDRCEWGVADGQLWVLQLGAATRAPVKQLSPGPAPSELIPLVQLVMAAPGVLGGELVLPWALAGPPSSSPTLPVGAGDLLDEAVRLAESLTSAVWGLPPSEAMGAARTSLARLRGPTPETEIATIRGLHQPDPDLASSLISTIHTLGESLVARGVLRRWEAVWHLSTVELRAVLDGSPVRQPVRAWRGIWEPLAAAVVLAHGVRHQGTPAAPGVGVGVRHHRKNAEAQTPPDRAVVTAPSAVPGLSQLIWGAAGLVTDLGSPAAHVFEVARSLGVPAVCGVDLESGVDQIVAVDGSAGVVATLPYTPLRSDDPVQPGGVEP